MHLIEELAAGIPDAPSGYARVTLRGTSTPATVYSDYAALHVIPGPTYNLGANGQLDAYVGELVDVYAYTAGGVLARGPTTQVKDAQATAYSGQSFTGQDVTTGLSAVQKPVALQTILELVKTKFGAIDFSVQKDVATTPATWNPSSLGVTVGTAWFSVKDPTYGCKGNGTADDTTGFQAAIDAAGAAGGGVVLVPPGTYNISAALTMTSAGVTIQGVGSPIIQSTSGSANLFTASASRLEWRNLRLKVADSVGANSTGYAIALATGSNFPRVYECTINNFISADTYQFARGIHAVNVDSAIIRGNNIQATTHAIRFDTATSSNCKIQDNVVATTGNAVSTMYFANCSNLVVTGNISESDPASGGTAAFPLDLVSVAGATVVGNTGPSGTLKIDNASTLLRFSGNRWNAVSYTPGSITSNHFNDSTYSAGTAASNGRYYSTATNTAAALTLPFAGMYDTYLIGDGSAAVTSIVTTGFPTGFAVTLIFNHAATGVGMTDGSNLKLAGNFTYNADDTMTLVFDGTNWFERSRSGN